MKRLALPLLLLGTGSPSHAADNPVRSIVCYSGGEIIYQGESDPAYAVYLGSADDHVAFVDRQTHKFTRVGGNCIVRWAIPAIH